MNTTINQLQNPIDYESYVNKHLIQALANMGQRLGIKGDSIKYKEFTFNDILGDTITYDPEKYIGVMYYDYIKEDDVIKPWAVFGYGERGKKLTKDNVVKIDDHDLNIRDTLYLNDTTIQFDSFINNIEYYRGILHNDSNELTLILKSKYQGYGDDDENGAEFDYFKFDLDTNTIVDLFKLSYLKTFDNGDKYYILIHLEKINNTIYKLHIYPINILNFTNVDFVNLFEKSFTYSDIVLEDEQIINERYVNIDKLFEYNGNEAIDSVFATLLNNQYNINNVFDGLNRLYGDGESEHPIWLKFNEDNSLFFSLDSDYEDSNDILINEFRRTYEISVHQLIKEFNNDINTLYYEFLNYYNNNYYLTSKANLLKHIFCKLYEDAIDDDMLTNANSSNIMYIPFDYKFTYMCNEKNPLELYYSNDIYITYSKLTSSMVASLQEKNLHNIIIDYYGLTKTKIFNFYLKYNSLYTNLINGIIVNELYCFPYINALNNWEINNYDTNISAIGKDAGNPNIIMEYYNSKSSSEPYKILNNISNKESILDSTWYEVGFKVDDALTDYAYIPEVTEDNVQYLSDAIIFVLTDTFHSSIWYLDTTDLTKPKFEYIKDPSVSNGQALRLTIFDSDIDLESYIQALQEAHLHMLLFVDEDYIGQVYNSQQYLNIRNRTAREYDESQQYYNNDFNAYLEYSNRKSTKGKYSIGYYDDSEGKYLEEFFNPNNEDLNIVSNYLYPKRRYKTETVNQTLTEFKTKIIDKIEYKYISNIIIEGDELRTEEELSKYISHQLEIYPETKKYTITIKVLDEKSQSGGGYYNEYVPNLTAPQADLKEILLRNINTLNRLNLLSFDSAGNIYNSYIGSDFNNSDKSTLHITSSETNVNIGDETLIDGPDRHNFKKQTNLSVSFDDNINVSSNNIDINSTTANINVSRKYNSGIDIYSNTIDNITYYNSIITPIGYLSDYKETYVDDEDNDFIFNLGIRLMDEAFIEQKFEKTSDAIETFEKKFPSALQTNDFIVRLVDLDNFLKEDIASSDDNIFTRIYKYKYIDEAILQYGFEYWHDAININKIMKRYFNIDLDTYENINIECGDNVLFDILTKSQYDALEEIYLEAYDFNEDASFDYNDIKNIIEFISTNNNKIYDLNNDGVIDMNDVLAIINEIRELEKEDANDYDVNEDGVVDISDITSIVNTIAGDNKYRSRADVNKDGILDDNDIKSVVNNIARKKYETYDVNKDGVVNISDVTAVINTIAGDDTYRSRADVNKDKLINIADVAAIIHRMAGIAYSMYDVNKDGKVDMDDVNEILNNYVINPVAAKYDINKDGKVDMNDITTLINILNTHKGMYYYLVINNNDFNSKTESNLGKVHILNDTLNVTWWTSEDNTFNIKLFFGSNTKINYENDDKDNSKYTYMITTIFDNSLN